MVSKWIEKVVARFSKPKPAPAPIKADMPITLEKFAKLHDGGVVSRKVLDELMSRDIALAPLPYVVPKREPNPFEVIGVKSDDGETFTIRADSFRIVDPGLAVYDPKPVAKITGLEAREVVVDELARAEAVVNKAKLEQLQRKLLDEGWGDGSPAHKKLAEELLKHADDEFKRLLAGDPDVEPRSFAGLEPVAPPVRGDYAEAAEF